MLSSNQIFNRKKEEKIKTQSHSTSSASSFSASSSDATFQLNSNVSLAPSSKKHMLESNDINQRPLKKQRIYTSSSSKTSSKTTVTNPFSTFSDKLLHHKLMGFLDRKTISSLVQTDKQTHQDLLGLQLLQAIVEGDEAATNIMIKNNIKKYPNLLQFRGTVYNRYTGQTIVDVNPLELAWGADDDDMCKMILSYMSDTEKKTTFKQLTEKFPESKEEKYDFSLLVGAINTLANGCNLRIKTDLPKTDELKKIPNSLILVHEKLYYVQQDGVLNEAKINNVTQFMDKLASYNTNSADTIRLSPEQMVELIKSNGGYDPIESALNKFRDDFKPGVIKKGKHFNVQTLIEAMGVYNNNCDSWSGDQCEIFWCKVIGYFQRTLPVCYAQAICQELYNVLEAKIPLKRCLKLVDGSLFYPVDLNSLSGLGFSHGIYCGMACRGDGRLVRRLRPGAAATMIAELMSNKNSSFSRLYAASRQSIEESVQEKVVSRSCC